MGSADTPGKMDEKLKSENVQKRAVFGMGGLGGVIKFSSLHRQGGIDPLTKMLRTLVYAPYVFFVPCSGVNASSRLGGRTTEWGGVWEGTEANWWRLIAE